MGPPPKDGLKTKRMICKEKLALKYQAQRNAKESARNRTKTKKEKTKKKSSDDESSIAVLLKEIRGDIKDIKADNREIKNDMKSMTSKIETIEKKQQECEEKTANEFKEIRDEIQANNLAMKDNIKKQVINQQKPTIPDKSVALKTNDVKKFIEEVLDNRKPG